MTILALLALAFIPVVIDMWTRRPGEESVSRAVAWSSIYVLSALTFALYLFLMVGQAPASLFLAGYVTEKALSMDNLIVFAATFAYFGVKGEYQHRVLHWGIIGSAVLRLIFIAVGLAAFFMLGRILDLLFGFFVIWTAWKMMGGSDDAGEIDHSKRWYIRWSNRLFPAVPDMDGRFIVRIQRGPLQRCPAATPLLFCLIAIEFTDIAFAFDSVPAVIGITRDAVLAYSSVMFAVVGLRAMYFVLEALKRYTQWLGTAVTTILYFVGGKMVLHAVTGIDIPPMATLAVIGACLAIGVVLSVGKGPLPSRWWAK